LIRLRDEQHYRHAEDAQDTPLRGDEILIGHESR
jgi:hypothetical protein